LASNSATPPEKQPIKMKAHKGLFIVACRSWSRL